MVVNGKEVKVAQAKRNPEDKFNLRIGAETAFGRLWEMKKKPKILSTKMCDANVVHTKDIVSTIDGHEMDKQLKSVNAYRCENSLR